MARFAVTIEYIDDKDKLQEIRPLHREYTRQLLDAGKLVESGPFTDGSGALLIYDVPDLATAQEQLAKDPYTPHGIIATATVREWNVVMSNLES